MPAPVSCTPHSVAVGLQRAHELAEEVVGVGRGRDEGYPAPPAQIPASGTTAPGSYLEWWRDRSVLRKPISNRVSCFFRDGWTVAA
jgi:hypothetical protein